MANEDRMLKMHRQKVLETGTLPQSTEAYVSVHSKWFILGIVGFEN